MSKTDDFVGKLKAVVAAVWGKVSGGGSTAPSIEVSEVKDAYEESAEKVRAAFSREQEKVQSADTVEKVQDESGMRGLAASELHKMYQLSRKGKLENAANLSVFVVRRNGGLDILRGKANNV